MIHLLGTNARTLCGRKQISLNTTSTPHVATCGKCLHRHRREGSEHGESFFALYENDEDRELTEHATLDGALAALREWLDNEEGTEESERGTFMIVRGVEIPLKLDVRTSRTIRLDVAK